MRFNHTKLFHGLLLLASLLLAACGGGGGSSGGGVVTVTPPAAPSGVSATAGCYGINIKWTAVSGATGYNIYGSGAVSVQVTTSNKLTATPVTATSYTDAGLASSTPRFYKVTAVNTGGESSGSSEVSATTTSGCTNKGGSIQGNPLVLTAAVTTLAGTTGIAGTIDGTGVSAQFSAPRGVTSDGKNLYVADTTNNTIRKIVISTGAVTTLAGSGAAGSTDGMGINATFKGPQGITTDGTYLYVADTQNSSIRKIVIFSGDVSTIVSTGLNFPAAITFDGAVSLYIADTNNNLIKKVATAGGTLTTFSTSSVTSPQGITFDGTGLNFYVTSGNAVLKVDTTGVVTAIVTTGLSLPQGITTDGTNLYVADNGNHTIRMVTTAGVVTTVAGSGTAGSADGTGTSASFSFPSGITTDGTNLYAVDTGNQTIRRIQ